MQNKLFRQTFLICLAVVMSTTILFGQQRTVTGKVVDETNAALPGASVVVKGTTIGTASDLSGNFSLQVPSDATTLVITFVGMDTKEVPITAGPMTITMTMSAEEVDAVVVVGYGTARKSELTGASVSVTGEQLAAAMTANLDQALQGRAAGVTAVYTSGQPGGAMSIRIRGQGTVRAAAAEPLYVIDGVPVQNISQSGHNIGLGDRLGNGSVQTFSGLSGINPADIVSMEILKDASATAIYGSRGANGVVLITTKSGKTGDARFSYEGYYGIQEQVARLDVMNLREFAEYSNDWAAETNGRDPRVEFGDPSILGEGIDWQNELFRTAPVMNHQLSAAGGSEKVKYYVSGGYFSQDGTQVGTDFSRYSARVNLDADLKKWLKLGSRIMYSATDENLTLNNSTEGVISVAMRTTPDVPVRNADGSWAGLIYEGAPSLINPIAKALDETNILKKSLLNANFSADITFIKGLTLRTELGGEISGSNAYHFTPTFKYGSLVNSTNTSRWQENQNFFWQIKNYLTYTNQFGRHNVTAMLGQEASEWSWEFLSGTANGLSSNDIQHPGLGDPKTMAINAGFGSGAIASFFARGNYSFADRYYLSYTFRYDGSSNFGPENRWAPFHAVSGSWRISQEKFWANMQNVVNDFKLRAGWGQTGNQNIGGYRWGASIYKMPSNLGMGFRQTNLANPYVGWEKQEQWNLGLDLGFIQNRINLVVDMYLKKSSDMLMELQLPSYMGTSGNVSIRLNPPMGNFGEIENRGLEFSLNTRPVAGRFTWENDLQLTFNRNRLLDLTTTMTSIEGYGQWTDVVSRSTVGQPLYSFYGYQVEGIYQDKEDILTSPRQEAFPGDGNFTRYTIWPGDIKFADLSGPNGEPDGVINELDRTYLGSPLPKFTFGFNNIFTYKNVELTVYMSGSYGNKIMNYVGRSLIEMSSSWTNQLQTAVDRAKLEPVDPDKAYPFVNSYGTTITAWYNDIDNVRVANPGTDIPRAMAGDPNDNIRISDRFIEDGSYLRFKNISLAYYLPKNIIRKIGVQDMKVYINLQNMWTITKYTGLDPEIGASQTNDFVFGLDNGRYPAARTYTFGLNFTL